MQTHSVAKRRVRITWVAATSNGVLSAVINDSPVSVSQICPTYRGPVSGQVRKKQPHLDCGVSG